ncbi:MAG: TrkA family potassium uptake protein [Clostridia bacterium]|nr:TrkA family potassium uptake protein [Clostridia bacterium]
MKSVLLIGLGGFGKHVARSLYELGHEVMAVDRRESAVNDVLPIVTGAQIGDSTNPEFLASLGINNYDVCIVAISNDFQSSLETTSLLKELGARLVVSRADRDPQEKFLLRNGADAVAYPEKQSAKWVAVTFTAETILDYIDLGDEQAIYEIVIPKEWLGKTIAELDVRRKYNINIIGFKQDGHLSAAVTPDTVFTEDKTLLVIGEYKAVHKICRN